uniref:Uncharacterized protein n=1 Tax=Amphimedon queenslandica TaxID=400682 RepID=A0A1X7SIH9_AMPQE
MAIQKVQTTEADTALIVSARGGDYETVKVLLDNGADPNEWDGVRTTALMAAINNKHHHVVELLLTEGADPSIMDN